MSSIILDPKEGASPRVTVCLRCGKSTGLVMLGVKHYKGRCPECDALVVGCGQGGFLAQCPKCKTTRVQLRDVSAIKEGDKIPSGLCDDCRKEAETHRAFVAAGGIYWKCKDCGSSGVLKPTAPICKAVREKLGVPAPKPCGIEFSQKEGCPVCSDSAEKQQPAEASAKEQV